MTREAIKCLVLSWMLLKLTPTMAGLYSVVVASTEGSVVSTNANRTVKRDDMVLIGGVFTTINGVARTKLARPTQLSPTPGFIAWWYCHTDQSAG